MDQDNINHLVLYQEINFDLENTVERKSLHNRSTVLFYFIGKFFL